MRSSLCAAAMLLLAAPVALGARSPQLSKDGARPAAPAAELPPAPQNLPQRADNMEVVGRFQVPGVEPGQIADVAVHKGYAYLNSWDDAGCEGGGTYVVDIRNPGSPQLVSFIPALHPYYHGEGAHVVSINTPAFKGDILAVNDETYGSNVVLDDPTCAPADKAGGGFDLYNVSDPANPVTLVQGAGDPDEGPGDANNSYHSVFVWQDGPRAYLVASDNVELADVDIFDITDPRNPVMVGDHDLVALFPQILDGEEAHGGSVFHHDMVVKHIGGKPVLMSDYWDAGYVQMDVSDPANPKLIRDTRFSGEDPLLPGTGITAEGNAHQGEYSFDNQFLLAADEDFAPFRSTTLVTSGPGAGEYPSAEAGDTATPIVSIPDRTLNGPTTYVGRACGGEAVPAPSGPLDPGEEHIALIERGDPRTPPIPDPDPAPCGFANKIANVAAAGWDGYVVFNQERPDDNLVNMLTGGATIPGVHMRRVDALAGLFGGATATPAIGTAGEDFEVTVQFDGWGYAHLYDANTSEHLDAFAIPESLDERFYTGFGDLSIHEFATDPTEHLAYSSYYAGGMRVFRYSRLGGLQQVGAWIDSGGSNFWGVEQFTAADGTRLIAGSDRDYGLVILRYTGPGAAVPPSCSAGSAKTTVGKAVQLPLTCSDANGNPLTRRIVQGPANGALGAIQGDSVLYTPNARFRGSDSIRFVASDGAAESQPATTTVTVSRPSNKISKLRVGKYKNGRVVVRLTVPGPGRLVVTMRANVRRGGNASAAKVVRLARKTRRPSSAGSVRVVLKLSKANRRAVKRTLENRKRIRARIRTAFTPTGGVVGRAGKTLIIRR